MYLTHDILVKHIACTEGIAFFDKHFPNGAELIDIINMPHIPHSFLHWGMNSLTTSFEEKAAYYARLNIKDSERVLDSEEVVGSTDVFKSREIYDSNNVVKSEQVTYSNCVNEGININNSSRVDDSSCVMGSDLVIQSTNVKDSAYILSSNYIIGSRNVCDSTAITKSSIVLYSEKITNSSFISHCSNLQNCLFCNDLHDQQYCIFNKPVEKDIFDFVVEQYKSFDIPDMQLGTLPISVIWDSVSIYHSPRAYLQVINSDDKLYNWIKHLPNYNPDILYDITYNSRIYNE